MQMVVICIYYKERIVMGGLAAAACGALRVFVVIRGQAFVGHAVTDFGCTDAAIAFLFEVNTLFGSLLFGLLSATGVELLGNRAKERDIATGVVLSFALGIEALSADRMGLDPFRLYDRLAGRILCLPVGDVAV